MLSYSATTTIHASPEVIWRILTDAPNYPTWNPSVLRIEGTIAPGKKVTAYLKRDPNRAFPAIVKEFVPNQHMTWVGGMPFGLFKGVRTYALMPKGGAVEFTIREDFSGPMLGMIKSSIPDMTQEFRELAAGLKAKAERG